jgi:phosphonate transport system permease protein
MSSNTPIQLPSQQYKRKVTIFSIATVIIALCCTYTGFNPIGIFTEFHYVQDLLGEMFMPNYHLFAENTSIGYAILQTLCMAFLGTLYGGAIALLLAFLAANNTMPYRTVRVITNGFIALTRIVPYLVVILIFVIAVGPGAFASVLTLTIITMGTFGKLFTELIENAENAPCDATYSVGATRMQVIRFAIFPQILPSLIANMLYAFDVNIRAAIALGVFGGGGIGYELQMAKSVLHYKDATALISIIVVLVILVEKLSDYLRRKILNEGKLQ